MLIEGLNDLGNRVELKTTNLGSYAHPKQILNNNEILEYANNVADIIILGSNHYVDHKKFWKIKSKKIKRVYVDGWDTSQIYINPLKFRKFDYVFKVNLYEQDNSIINLFRIILKKNYTLWSIFRSHYLIPYPYFHSMQNLTRFRDILKNTFFILKQNRMFPFPFSIEKRCQGIFNNKPQFMLSCMLSDDRVMERKKIIELLKIKQLPDAFIGKISEDKDSILEMEGMNGFDPDLPHDLAGYAFHNKNYYHQIQQSRACISVPGGGFDTFRFWEVLGQGSLLISKRIAIRMPNPPVEGTHYMAFDDIEELKALIEWLYNNPDNADQIRYDGWKYALKYHTSRARAEYFMEILKQ